MSILQTTMMMNSPQKSLTSVTYTSRSSKDGSWDQRCHYSHKKIPSIKEQWISETESIAQHYHFWKIGTYNMTLWPIEALSSCIESCGTWVFQEVNTWYNLNKIIKKRYMEDIYDRKHFFILYWLYSSLDLMNRKSRFNNNK